MISVSSDYKNYISNNLSVSAKNKIIVDGVEYLGNVLKTYPKISHSTSKICGSFPAKTVSFEIYDLNNSLDFENKEIEVYKGLMLNGTPYYVKQGVFIPQKDNITTNISDRSIKFDKVQDKTQFLDDKYESELDWSNSQTHTGLEIVQEICTKKSLTLKSNSFAWASYNFNQPNFPSNITYRQVLARLGEIGGETVIFDYKGELEFKSQYTTGDTIGRSRYRKISKEKSVTFNSVVLGKQGINDDIKYPANMLDSNRVSFRIEDNPFVDLYREEMIEDVADFIIGLTYVPFACDSLLDGFIYELNDVISITDRNNETLRAVILSIDNSSRISSNIKLDTTIQDNTDYNLAGSSKQELANVRLDVDHIDSQIRSVVSKVDEVDIKVNGGNEYTLTTDTTFKENKDYYIKSGDDYIEYPQYKEYLDERTGNPSTLGLYEYDDTNDTYVLTEDTTFDDDKEYYIKQYDIGDTIPSDTYYEMTTYNGIYEDYAAVLAELNNKASLSSVSAVESSVKTLQTNTYSKTQVQEIASGTGYFKSEDTEFGATTVYYQYNSLTQNYDVYVGARTGSPQELGLYEFGQVSAVVSTEATFNKDGMRYTKTNGITESLINLYGLEVDNLTRDSQGGISNREIGLYAGYVPNDATFVGDLYKGQTIVYTKNLVSRGYTEVGVHGRFEEYPGPNDEAGTGFFII